jgi:hypothetical protein
VIAISLVRGPIAHSSAFEVDLPGRVVADDVDLEGRERVKISSLTGCTE